MILIDLTWQYIGFNSMFVVTAPIFFVRIGFCRYRNIGTLRLIGLFERRKEFDLGCPRDWV